MSINSITAYRSPNDYSITWSSGGGEGSVQMITVLHRVCRANDYGVYTMILEGLYKEFKDLTKKVRCPFYSGWVSQNAPKMFA